MFWRGDSILWKNLFKNYLLCLDFIHVNSYTKNSLDDSQIPVFLFEPTEHQKEYTERRSKLFSLFFNNASVIEFLDLLTNSEKAVRKPELIFYLKLLHPVALSATFLSLFKNKPDLENYYQFATAHLNTAIKQITQKNGKRSIFESSPQEFDSGIKLIEQYNLAEGFAKQEAQQDINRKFVVEEFPERYVNQLENLTYPIWHTSCFTENYSNASMWGHYADRHTGVCLKFKTFKNAENANCINLKIDSSKDFNLIPLHKVNYEEKYPSINFFCSMGNLPIPKFIEEWLSDEGKYSNFISNFGEEKWREQYWKAFYQSSTIKLKDWKFEQEHRIIFANHEAQSKGGRLLNYRFSDLEAIYFGIKTPPEKKIEILKISQDLCKKFNSYNIAFFQAYYSTFDGKINFIEMPSLKF
jgi:hypothetical protein